LQLDEIRIGGKLRHPGEPVGIALVGRRRFRPHRHGLRSVTTERSGVTILATAVDRSHCQGDAVSDDDLVVTDEN
jgi:hypothetical protein